MKYTLSAEYRLNPPFTACMRWAFTYFLIAVVVLCLITVGMRIINKQPLPAHWFEDPSSLILTLVVIALGMGIAIFALLYILGAVVTRSHLRASTYWGRRVNVPWSSITNVTIGSYEGLPAVIIQSDVVRAEVYVYVLGIDRREAHAKLSSMAGPDHILTKCFAE
jgi:hypothetical protein